jgi:PAS domain S-box-containing protein
MNDLLNKLITYFYLPEMRIFWIFLPLVIGAIIISFIFVPSFLAILISGILLAIEGVVFASGVSLARFNLDSRRYQKQLESIIAGLTDGVITYDQNFKILLFSQSAERIFNLSAKEVIDKVISPKDVENPKLSLLVKVLYPALAPVMVNRSNPGVYPQVVDLSFDSPKLELRVSTSLIKDVNNKTLGFVKIVRDQTRDVEILKSKSEFVTVTSHQLRTPLTSLRWIFESLAGDKTLSPENHQFASDGLSLVEQMVKIVNDLLNIASIEEGRFGYNFEETDIVDFIGKILSDLAPQARQYSLNVFFDKPDEPLPHVFIDKSKMGIVLNNLLSNAVRYNVKNGEIAVSVKKLENQPFIEISVRDTGIGIPEEEIGKLFTEFYRASNAVATQTEGSGLGLYIVKNIVEAHGGKIWVESAINKGSIFYFTLPTDMSLVPKHEVPQLY